MAALRLLVKGTLNDEKTFSLQFCWEEHCKEDTRHSSLGRLSHCSSVGKSIAKRMPGTALWEDLLFAVLLGRALQRGYPAQLFGKTFSLQFCWEKHCKEDARHSSLGRPSLCSSVGKSIAKRIPGTALWEDFLIAVLLGRALRRGYPAQLFGKTFSLQFCWEEHCEEDTRHSSLGRPSLCSSVGKSIAKRMPGTALWEDLLFAVLLGRALQRGYPAQLFGKTFSLQFCREKHCKEDARHSSLGRPSLCSSVGKSIAKRIPGTALWEDLLIAVLVGKALQRGCPAQLFGKTFSLQFCWEEHCKEDTRRSSLGKLSPCSSVGKSIAKRIPGAALWEDLLFAVLLGRALRRGYPAQLFGKTFSLQFCWEEHCKEDARHSSLGRPSLCSSVGKSIAKRIPGAALWEDFLIAVLLGRALRRGYPAQLFGKTFSLQFCWEEHCEEDTRRSSLRRPSLCSSVGKSIAKRMPGTALWEDLLFAVLLGRALQRGCPAQLFEKTFSLQFCWEEHCKEDTRRSSLGRLSHCSSVGKSIAKRMPGAAL